MILSDSKLVLGLKYNYLDVGISRLKGELGQSQDAVRKLDGLVDDRQALLAPPCRHREHVLNEQ